MLHPSRRAIHFCFRDRAERAEATNPLRVFFAVWPDAPTRAAIAALAHEAATAAGGKAPRAESLHLTLAFVGEVPVDRVAALRAIGADAARPTPPFTMTLDRLGGFRDSGIAWLGTTKVPADLEALVDAMRKALAAAGFPVDPRPFRVHVTLARRCRNRVRAATIAPTAWRVERMTLTASELGGEGSRYRELAAWPLGRADFGGPR
jgi:2'-5' RNA ligase